MSSTVTFFGVTQSKPLGADSQHTSLRSTVLSLITHGYAVMKMPMTAQIAVWSTLDGISRVPKEQSRDFCFPDRTDGFLLKGGEHAKYTENVDLCDRFCYWHKHRGLHSGHPFVDTPVYKDIQKSESELWSLSQRIVSGLWDFFRNEDQMIIRDSSYVQLCMYENGHQVDDRGYLQDRHEDGHLITLIKPTRDGLVIFLSDEEVPVHLADDEIIVITGSLLTLLSDGKIPTMYHAVRNPKMELSRKSLVYFAIPDLGQPYTTLLEKKTINIASIADESHRAFGNAPLI
ncbi:2OG-Fe(II) oxygenase family protein [Variovorax sp. J22P271]|uniref:2OG-Fe(II) oxygenase family protein n=1 Tax=Variovorax davisae TaxID=3053515 RepID=UPI002579244A|nr:2OG-Fe(II) oxygenase family protein [Variovorax sp. J22P271]MDM0034750.1 2OG-Fe(II) oxygenase family protein [Variovorax sp. J22P271]